MTKGTSRVGDTNKGRTLRVVQWATGRIGKQSLRAVIEHPQLSLVGVHVFSAEKEGCDAGELCGLSETGVQATRDINEIIALDADCILYMPRMADDDELCQLLASGANVVVVTTRGEFYRPESLDPGQREKLEAACQRGKSTLHSTGSSPGFITEAVPLVLTSLQRRLDCLTIDEFGDLTQYASAAMIFDTLGFGLPPAEFDPERHSHILHTFGPPLQLIADALSIQLDSIELESEIAITPQPIEIVAGPLEAGSVAAQRHTVLGMSGGRAVLRFRLNWYCTKDIEPAWPLNNSGWHIEVEGDVPLEIDIGFPVPMEQMAVIGPSTASNRAINCISGVCAAVPGIATTLDFPPVAAMLG